MAIPVFDLSQVTGIRKNSTTPPLISTRAGLIDGTRPGGGDPDPVEGIPVFADRTKTVTANAAGGGDGSTGSPWTLSEAMTNAVAGDVIGISAGVYVGSDPGAGAGNRFTPAFGPANSGTSENPIWFVAENLAVNSATGRTEIYSGATTIASGWPAYGSLSKDYIKWSGIYSNETASNGKSASDSAPYVVWSGVGCENYSYRIIGQAHSGDNHSGIRIENTVSFKEANGIISGFDGGTNEAGILVYKSHSFDLGNGEIYDCTHDIQIKGSTDSTTDTIYGFDIHHKLIHDVSHMFRLHGPVKGPSGELSKIRNCVAYNVTWAFEFTSSGTHVGEQDGLRVFNNTIDVTGNDPAAFWINHDFDSAGAIPRDNVFFNNIIVGAQHYWGSYGDTRDLQFFIDFMESNRNIIDISGSVLNGSTASGIDDVTITQWRAAGMDQDSAFESPTFVDAANRDYHLSGAQTATTIGRDLLNQFGGGVNSTIPAGAYVTGDETIGVVA